MAAKRWAERNRNRQTARGHGAAAERLEDRTLFAFGITELTTTLATTAGTAGPANVIASGSNVFFTASDPSTGNTAVWTSNGTAAGTAPLGLPTGVSGAATNLLAAVGDSTSSTASVFFNIGNAAYHSDGTTAGTAAVTVPDTTLPTAPLTVVGTFNDNVILLANNGASQELYEQNAASNGPVDLGTIPAGLTPGGASATVGGTFYFALGGQLWSTTGTAGSAAELTDTGATSLADFTPVGASLYFQAATASNQQLWTSDGTGPGTTDLLPTATTVGQLTPLNNQLVFVAQTADDANGSTLWHSTGTASGTVQLSAGVVHVGDLGVVSGKAFLVGFSTSATSTAVLYTTTGTTLTSVRMLGTTSTPGMLVSNTPSVEVASEAAFLAPGPNSQSALYTSFGITNTTDIQVTDAPAGTLSAGGNDLLFDVTPTTASAPGELYVLNGSASGGSTGPITNTGALLTPAVTAVTLPATFVPGDTGTVTLTLTNSGDAAANGSVSIDLFLENAGSLTTAVPVTAASLANVHVALGVGAVRTLRAKFIVPSDVPTGSDQLSAVLGEVSNLVPGEVSTGPVTATSTATAALSFGVVGARKNVVLRTADAAGTPVTYSLPGGGTGTVSLDASGNASLALTGTTPASQLRVQTSRGTTTTLTGISAAGSLNQIAAPTVAVSGALTVEGSLRSLTAASLTNATVSISGSLPTALSLGADTASSLSTTGPISTMRVASWSGGTIAALSLGTFIDAGSFSGTANISNQVGVFQVHGDIASSTILAGITGGTATDATVGTLRVVGSITGATLIGVALSPPAGTQSTTNPGSEQAGRIKSITIGGTLDPAAKLLAATLPARVSIDRQSVLTAGNTNFTV